ncbi:MAG: IS3 family transposase [Agarilytica sp.]
MKYAFIREQSAFYRAARLISVLGVSASGYYDWLRRPESRRARENRALVSKIKVLHRASHQIYGSPRVHRDLLSYGESVGVNRVARLMRDHGIKSKMAKRFVVTTDSKNTMDTAPDRLKRNFYTAERDTAWVSDTTFIATREGWMYLAVVIDLYSRMVVGWSMSKSNNAQLVQDALTMAIWRRGVKQSVVVHSDQGSTYASKVYQEQLEAHGLICSMSRKGECLDNAVAESFFGTLKTEWVDRKVYSSRKQAKQSIFEYIEVFYNRKRRHSYLGYVSPEEFERMNAY